MKHCLDIYYNQSVKAVYFDGTSNTLKEIQDLIIGTNNFNIDLLYTKIGWWLVKYPNGSLVWKKNKCFHTNYKII